MSEQILRDERGIMIGKILTRADGFMIIYDFHGITKGNYDPKSNITRDTSGKKVGTGNLLTMLL